MVLRSLYQLVGSALALDHALVMLLLLVGLLSIRERQRRYVPWVILMGVALSLFTPAHSLEFTWPIISARLATGFTPSSSSWGRNLASCSGHRPSSAAQ